VRRNARGMAADGAGSALARPILMLGDRYHKYVFGSGG
jgi:hypothetical protein